MEIQKPVEIFATGYICKTISEYELVTNIVKKMFKNSPLILSMLSKTYQNKQLLLFRSHHYCIDLNCHLINYWFF